SEYGGAPLLGVAGATIVGHGRSSAKAVRNAVAMAYRFAADRFIERVERDIAAAVVPHQRLPFFSPDRVRSASAWAKSSLPRSRFAARPSRRPTPRWANRSAR